MTMNSDPYHQLAGPADVWVAEADSAEPDLSVTPGSINGTTNGAFTATPVPKVTGGSGTGAAIASITVNASGQITAVTWVAGSSGYATGDVLRITQGRVSVDYTLLGADQSSGVLVTLASKTLQGKVDVWTEFGNNSLTDTGVEITRGQEMFRFRPFGNLGPSKVFRISETWGAKVEVADMTADTYAEAMGLEVTEVAAAAGVAGAKRVPLMRGRNVKLYAVLFRRLVSPYGPGDFSSQYWVPRAEIDPLEEPNIVEGAVSFLGCTFMALEHPTHGFGNKTDQTAPAT